jgi:DNA polymerase III alpha subunit
MPRIDRDLLEKYHEGLICLTGCMGSGTHILNGNLMMRRQQLV